MVQKGGQFRRDVLSRWVDRIHTADWRAPLGQHPHQSTAGDIVIHHKVTAYADAGAGDHGSSDGGKIIADQSSGASKLIAFFAMAEHPTLHPGYRRKQDASVAVELADFAGRAMLGQIVWRCAQIHFHAAQALGGK